MSEEIKAFVGGLATLGKAERDGRLIDIYDSVQKIVTIQLDESVIFPESFKNCVDYFTQVIRVENDIRRLTIFFEGTTLEEIKIDGVWYIENTTRYKVDRTYFNWQRGYIHVGYEKSFKSLLWLYVDVETPSLLYSTDIHGKIYSEIVLEEPLELKKYNLHVAYTQALSLSHGFEYFIFEDNFNKVSLRVKEVNKEYGTNVPCLPSALSGFENALSKYFGGKYIESW